VRDILPDNTNPQFLKLRLLGGALRGGGYPLVAKYHDLLRLTVD
jgi:hypothetical protein